MTLRAGHLRGLILATAGAVVLSPDALILRLVEIDRWSILFWRGLLTGVALTAVFAAGYRRDLLDHLKVMGRPGLLAALLFAITSILFVSAVTLTSVANALVIVSAAPLFAAILSFVFLHEHIALRTWVAVIVGFLGMTIIFSGNLGGGALLGDLCAVGTACFLAANFTVVRHARAINMVPSVALSGFIVALVVFPLATPLLIEAQDFMLLSLLGLVILPLSMGLIMQSPRYLPAAEVSLIMLLEAILGPLWVWLTLGEIPRIPTFVGGGLVLATLVAHALLGLRRA